MGMEEALKDAGREVRRYPPSADEFTQAQEAVSNPSFRRRAGRIFVAVHCSV